MGKPVTDLGARPLAYGDGHASILIVRDNGDIPGGVTLDLGAYRAKYPKATHLEAGHAILLNAQGLYQPVDPEADYTNGEARLIGLLKQRVSVANPSAAVLVSGVVNAQALPFGARMEAIASQLKGITLIHETVPNAK